MHLRLLIIAFCIPLLAWSQDTDSSRVPATLTADVPELVGRETSKSNELTAAFAFNSIYDSNLQSSRTNRVSDWRFGFAPAIRIDQNRPQLHWDLQYQAEVSRYRELPVDTQANHQLTASLTYRLTPRFKFRLRQDYLRSMDPFSILEAPIGSLGVANSPNQTVILPSATRSVITSLADVQYALSPHSDIGVTGTFIKSEFTNPEKSLVISPLSGQTLNGSVYYSAKVSPRSSVGLQYVLADMSYDHSSARVQTNSLLIFTTVGFDDHSSLMLWGGPENARSRGSLFGGSSTTSSTSKDEWNPAFGVVYSWVGDRTDFGATATKRVSDGGGIMDAVSIISGSFAAGRRFTPFWTGRTSIAIARNENLSLSSSSGTLRSIFATLELERQISSNLRASFSYDRVYQDGKGTYAAIGSHNRFQLSLRYLISRPLGK